MDDIGKSFISILIGSNGPDERKGLFNEAVEAFDNGKEEISIYYQVRALFNLIQNRYYELSRMAPPMVAEISNCSKSILKNLNNISTNDDDDELIKCAKETLRNEIKNSKTEDESCFDKNSNFLENSDPIIGFKKIIDICKQLPQEWTVLQVMKGPRPQTTYSDFYTNHQRESDIYLTLLHHARSSDYPEPICIRLSSAAQEDLFDKFSKIASDCKKYMHYNYPQFPTHADKYKYWEQLKVLDRGLQKTIEDFRQYVFPWLFLFRGKPRWAEKNQKNIFTEVDKFCDANELGQRARILLSLALLQINELEYEEMEVLCEELSLNESVQRSALLLFQNLRCYSSLNSPSPSPTTAENAVINNTLRNYPCILIVDENLDHFFWEELNVCQEMCRIGSLHCLWKLFSSHKEKIKNGYFCVNANKNGGCILNPDKNLPKSEMRLRSFFEYFKPSWLIKCQEKPIPEELYNDFFKRNCYVYAGHGSGLQYISGKKISKQNINAIVFLFGCDSTRMHSNGLYSDMHGTHYFYHAAMCPCLVGSILPALDTQMDSVAAEILSRWIHPDTDGVSWQQIDLPLWTKKGIIQKSNANPIIEEPRIESLCGVVSRIHQRLDGKYYYNTVPYICRGLPIWNSDIRGPPE